MKVYFSTVDLLPTFCDLANKELPGSYQPDGESFISIFENVPFERTKPLFWDWHFARVSDNPRQINSWPENAVRFGEWKLLHNSAIGRTELYNITQDPFEKNNLTESKPEKVIELMRLLREWKSDLPK